MEPSLKLVTRNQPVPGLMCENLTIRLGGTAILSNITLSLPDRGVSCIVGPSGAGKSTFLRSLNRIDDGPDVARSGQLNISGGCVLSETNLTNLRRRVGLVFQRPTVFPTSIKANVLFGVRDQKLTKSQRADLVESCLRRAALWSELGDRLNDPAHHLSLGQQQRLCIARTLAVGPDVLLLDEPTASIDPRSALAIETLVSDFAKTGLVVMVTHNIAQARRVADTLIFFCDGRLLEYGPARYMFSRRSGAATQTYLGEEFCDC